MPSAQPESTMNTNTLVLMIQIAGVLHFGLICAGLLMPRAVNARVHVARLPPFLQRLFWVYYIFIGFCLVSFGAMSIAFAHNLTDGSALARAICIFLAIFWIIRLYAATFVFDVRPYLTNNLWRLGYQATNIVFAYLPVAYAVAAWKGNTP
jgi:FtsH-binding integral membrane protein